MRSFSLSPILWMHCAALQYRNCLQVRQHPALSLRMKTIIYQEFWIRSFAIQTNLKNCSQSWERKSLAAAMAHTAVLRFGIGIDGADC